MTRSDPRTRQCTAATRAARLDKARQFWRAAEALDTLSADRDDLSDAYVTLCIHAGIASADVICCARLGMYAQGQDHDQAITLLASADKPASRHLATLLAMKTRTGYGEAKSSRTDRARAGRAARALIDAADMTT